jgi:hypothetical protein
MLENLLPHEILSIFVLENAGDDFTWLPPENHASQVKNDIQVRPLYSQPQLPTMAGATLQIAAFQSRFHPL